MSFAVASCLIYIYFFCLQIIHDLNYIVDEVCGDYLGHVLGLLKSCSAEVLDLVKQSILQGSNSLKVLQPPVINSIVEALVEKSVEVRIFLNFISISNELKKYSFVSIIISQNIFQRNGFFLVVLCMNIALNNSFHPEIP